MLRRLVARTTSVGPPSGSGLASLAAQLLHSVDKPKAALVVQSKAKPQAGSRLGYRALQPGAKE